LLSLCHYTLPQHSRAEAVPCLRASSTSAPSKSTAHALARRSQHQPAFTWATADSGSSQKHAIISECEHNLTFMSPARDQFARTTTRFCTRSLLIVVAQAPWSLLA